MAPPRPTPTPTSTPTPTAMPIGETKGWWLTLLSLPVQEQPLSLVISFVTITLILANGLTTLVLNHGEPSQNNSIVSPRR